LNGNKVYFPPNDDEFEISLFGPGYGESVVIHIGGNNWVLVDSAIDPTTRKPAALTYLQKLGIDPSNAVKLVVATHWHDDHIRGLGEVLSVCKSAQFCCSGALRASEFLTLVGLYGTRLMIESSGIKEFHTILRIMESRRKKIGRPLSGIKLAIADRTLWRQSVSVSGQTLIAEIHSLSPSDASILKAQKDIGSLLPVEKETKRRVSPGNPNHVAVVLWVSIGDISVLLGSDLQETKQVDTGWSVIVNSPNRPPGRASAYKIPHHGSGNAHNNQVWTDMLQVNPYSLLTPFVTGKSVLPKKEDVKRICRMTKNAFATASIKKRKSPKRSKTVEKMIRETVRKINEVFTSEGQIRLRRRIYPKDNFEVDLIGGAVPLENIHLG